MIFAKRVRKKCEVRGCRNLDSFAISKSREAGNSIIICKECLGGGLDAVKALGDAPKVKKISAGGPPPLFFGDVLRGEKKEGRDSSATLKKTDGVDALIKRVGVESAVMSGMTELEAAQSSEIKQGVTDDASDKNNAADNIEVPKKKSTKKKTSKKDVEE